MRKSLLLACGLALTVASTAGAFPIAIAGTEGLPVIVSGTNPVIATYQGNSASFFNDLYLALTATGPGLDGIPGNDQFVFNNQLSPVGSMANLGSFPVGTELTFRLFVNNTGNNFFTGDPSRNPDGLAHARVQANWQPGETLVSFEDLFGTPEGVNGFNDLSFSFTNTTTVPEPASFLLGTMAMAGFAIRRRYRETRNTTNDARQ